jgi:hypothetical protein
MVDKETETEEKWIAKSEEINDLEFEESRRCLFNSYHSYIQNHVGYLILMGIALLGLGSTYEALFRIIGIYFFTFLVGLFFFGIFIDFLRIQYYNYFVNVVLGLTKKDAIKYFNQSCEVGNSYYLKKGGPAPCIAILQIAVFFVLNGILANTQKKLRSRIFMKLVLKT